MAFIRLRDPNRFAIFTVNTNLGWRVASWVARSRGDAMVAAGTASVLLDYND